MQQYLRHFLLIFLLALGFITQAIGQNISFELTDEQLCRLQQREQEWEIAQWKAIWVLKSKSNFPFPDQQESVPCSVPRSEYSTHLRKAIHSDDPTASGWEGAAKLEVWNTLSWTRGGVIELPAAVFSEAKGMKMGSRGNVISQRLSNGGLAFRVRRVPPLGATRLGPSDTTRPGLRRVKVTPFRIASPMLSVEIDPASGRITQLYHKRLRKNVVDSIATMGLHSLWVLDPDNPERLRGVEQVSTRMGEVGPLVGSLIIEGSVPGFKNYSLEIRLVMGEPMVEFIHRFEKLPQAGELKPKIALPMDFRNVLIQTDQEDKVILPTEKSQFKIVEQWTALSTDTCSVWLTSPKAWKMEFRELASVPTNEDTDKFGQPMLFSHPFPEGIPAAQPVEIHYYLKLQDQLYAPKADIFAQQIQFPLRTLPIQAGQLTPAPLFKLGAAEFEVKSLTPVARSKGYEIELFNSSKTEIELYIEWETPPQKVLIGTHPDDTFKPFRNGVWVPGHGTQFLRVE